MIRPAGVLLVDGTLLLRSRADARPRRAARRAGGILLAAFLTGCGLDAPREPADRVFRGGPIVTVNDEVPSVEAVAVRHGRVFAVGSEEEIAALTGPDTEITDLAGRTLAPGFVDGHVHMMGLGAQAVGANLLAPPDGGVETIDDLVAVMREAASGPALERTGWIFGMGYDDAVLAEGRHPTRDDLDRVSTDVPVLAIHISGHFAAVNSLGLEQFGYSVDSVDPEGGVIRRRAGGNEPNGVLEELAAIPKFVAVLSPTNPADAAYFMEQGLEMAESFGYTTIQEGRAFGPTHETLVSMAEQGMFGIDVVSYIDYTSKDVLDGPWHGRDYRDRYRVGGLKITLDGSPQGRTAWRTTPYLVPPEGQEQGYLGYPAIPQDSVVAALFEEAYEKGWQVLSHANGDAAMDQLIRAIRAVHASYEARDRRHVLIHGQFVREDQLDAFAELDVIPSLFPMHTFYWGDWYDVIVGPEQAQRISPMRSAIDLGMLPTSHTDAPVALPNLMQVMWATVNRTSRSGQVMGPEERLTPLEALKTITLWGARQHFEEDTKGSIEEGKLADLVILSDNPLTIDPAQINQILVLETIKEGETVWRRE